MAKQIKTKDNSVTLLNESLNETYHSTSGAIEESFLKYAIPAKEYLKGNIVLFDVCYGLGYNAAAAVQVYFEQYTAGSLKIIGFEIDENLPNVRVPEYFQDVYSYPVNVVYGDARKTILNVKEKADVVFLDPFSPKKMPDLWTKEFLKSIYDKMKPNSILCTYSCARSVRDNLKAAGFVVEDGPKVARRGPSTIARKLFK